MMWDINQSFQAFLQYSHIPGRQEVDTKWDNGVDGYGSWFAEWTDVSATAAFHGWITKQNKREKYESWASENVRYKVRSPTIISEEE